MAADRRMPVRPFSFGDLPSFRREEIRLWNWFQRAFPGRADWQDWAGEVFSRLLLRPAGRKVTLIYRDAVGPEGEDRRFVVDRDEIEIGRAPENGLVLAAKAIGRHHARLICRGGELLLEDMGSQFGTHLGTRKLEPRRPEVLRDGDRFVIFPYEFRVSVEIEWEPESQARIFAEPATSSCWENFAARSAAGSKFFRVFVHPVREAAWLETDTSFLLGLARRLVQPLGIEARECSLLPCDEELIQFTLLSVLEMANRAARFPFRVELGSAEARLPADGEPGAGVSLCFSVGLSDLTGAFRLFVPYRILGQIEHIVAEPAVPPDASRISWPVKVSAGWVDLLPDELAGLEPLDILLFTSEPCAFLPGSFEKGWKSAVAADNPWRVRVDKYADWSVRMQESTAPQPGAPSAPDFRTIPVRLHVILGEKELTLAEMNSLVPNTILELDTGKADPVRLAVNGRIVGEGELVEVDGKLGVRILRWS